MASEDILDAPLRDFLDTVAGAGPAPAAGSAAAIVVAMSAGLLAMVGRASKEHWPEAAGAVAQAEALRARATPLAQADAAAYLEALNALKGRDERDQRDRDARLGRALDRAAEIPLRIAETGCDVALLAALLTEHGNPDVRGDAAAAGALAEGATRAAAKLVAINLSAAGEDERLSRAQSLVDSAAEAAQRALAAAQ